MTHTELVKELAKPGSEIRRSISGLDAHLMHMTMGIAGEVGEVVAHVYRETAMYQNDDMVEECGDIEFYIEGYKQGLLELDPALRILSCHQSLWLTELDWTTTFIEETAAVTEFTKKYVVYRKKLNVQLLAQKFENIHGLLNALYARIGVTREYVLERNIIKLTKRYESGYSDAAAIARVDVIK